MFQRKFTNVGRLLSFGVASVLTLVLLTPQASAANAQGLYWGVETGDTIDYKVFNHWSLPNPFATMNESFYILVNAVPTIPERVANVLDIPLPNVTLYWKNGSDMGPSGILPSVVPSPSIIPSLEILPVGNWSLMTTVILDPQLTHGVEIINNESMWGGHATGEGPYDNTTVNAVWTLLKSDGAWNHWHYIITNVTTQEEVYHYEVDRLVYETGAIPSLYLIAITGVLIVISIGIVLILKYRR
ncbi:MAG: hypothetical protein C4K47_05640 [Candidatus Thorarchaeota archaeon]|nr:MAG: hypothetical protein C4K47_05640 [Candidatus Thorarchaeota archaeon]